MANVNKNNLVVLKSRETSLISEATQTTFIPNKHYRCIELTEGDYSEFLVYGVVFSKEAFENLFEYLHDRMTDEWSEIGLLPMMKPLSKSAFVEVLNVHQYGKGKNKLWIGFAGSKMDGIWAFQCLCQGDTKARFLSQAYAMYGRALNGDMTDIDDELLQRGDSGAPVTFGDIYFRKPWNPNNEKKEIYC